MNLLIPFVTAIVLFCGTPGMAGNKTDDFIFFEYYRNFREAFKNHLDDARSLKADGAGNLLKTCWKFGKSIGRADYTDMPKQVWIRDDSCYAHVLLQKAEPHSGYRPSSFTEELYRRLDFKSFLNSTQQRMVEGNQHTLADLKNEKFMTEGAYAVYLDEEDWHEGVCVISDADFNGNGKPDWLIVAVASSKTGTLRYSDVLVAYDVEPTGLIKAESLVPPE